MVGPLIGLAAAAVGVIAGVQPELAIAAAFMVAFVILVLADLISGLALFTFVAFLEIVPFGGPALSFSKALGLLLALSWLTLATTSRSVSFDPRVVRPVAYLLVALLAWVMLSISWAESPEAALNALSRYALNAMLFVIVVSSVRERPALIKLLAAFVAGAAFAAMYGLANPGELAADYGRLESAALDPNELAAVLVPAFALCLFAAVGLRENATLRLVSAVVGLMCGTTIVLTVSRGGLIALVVTLVVAVIVAGRWRLRVGAIAATAAAAAFIYFAGFASPQVVEHLEATTQGDARLHEGRVTIWQTAWRMGVQNPVRGVGGGNFPVSSIHYVLEPGLAPRSDLIVDTPLVAHNTYLETFAELGVIGLALFLALILFCLGALVKAISAFKRAGDADMELLARGLLAALCGLLVADFFISEQFSKALWLLLALAPATLVVARRTEQRESSA